MVPISRKTLCLCPPDKLEVDQGVELCKFVRIGDEDLPSNHDEVRFTAGSHDVLYATASEDVPTENHRGDPVSQMIGCLASAPKGADAVDLHPRDRRV